MHECGKFRRVETRTLICCTSSSCRFRLWTKVPSPLVLSVTGVNFINILRANFLFESKLSSFYLLRVWLWTNFGVKNSGKLTTGVNFINIKLANFIYKSLFSNNVLALNKLLYKKCARKTLMKLSPGLPRNSRIVSNQRKPKTLE